jgi:glycosyltransferase involved in cell wall biosynthesis
MKIAIVSDVFYPYLMGGAERRYWEIARRLARDNEVHVFTMRWHSYPRVEELEGMTIHRMNVPGRLYSGGRRSIYESINFSLRLFPRFFRNHGFEVIDANQFPFFPLFPAKVLSKKCDCPLIATWHEVWRGYWYSYMGSWLGGYIGEKIEACSAKLPDHILAVSQETRKALMKGLGIPGERISVVHNGIDRGLIDSVEAGRADGKILYAGRLLPHKNVEALIRAMPGIIDQVRDAKLTIVGEGPMKEELIRLARKLDLEKHVEFLGMLDYEGVIRQMKSSTVFVLPSLREGFGMALVEAMAAGTPVIAVKAPGSGVAEVVNGRNGILCPPGELEKNILRLLLDPALRKKLAREGRRYSRAFDWDTKAEEVLRVYENAVQ